MIAATRRQGYAVRDPSHRGPDADMAARFCAIAVPVQVGPQVAACLSCVWLADVTTVDQIVVSYLAPLQSTAAQMGERLLAPRC